MSDRLPAKTSIGIILCRKNATTLRPEALLVHKRYTYAFAEFVHGRYSRKAAGAAGAAGATSGPGPPAAPAALAGAAALSGPVPVSELLDNMSREELLDVYSLNFNQMWYRIWLTHNNRDLFQKKQTRFQSAFMRDGGAELRQLCLAARGVGSPLWEVPKGRRQGSREPDIACAVRELQEETGVCKSEFRLIPGALRRTSYVSAGIRYIGIYYVAHCLPTSSRLAAAEYSNSLRDLPNLAEVGEVRWHDIERIRLIDSTPPRLVPLLKPVFSIIHDYCAGRWYMRNTRPIEFQFPPGFGWLQAASLPALPPVAQTAASAPVATPAVPINTAPPKVVPQSDTRQKSDARQKSASPPAKAAADDWQVVRSRRQVRSMRGAKANQRARILIDTCVPSDVEVITDAFENTSVAVPAVKKTQTSNWRAKM
jgi:8-oxo-dGTP pyrophosphatase MutT (NUDIX family)